MKPQQTYPHLRILCFGAGAIGSYIGGSLALRGHTVVFLDRPEMAEALRSAGLIIQDLTGTHHLEHPNLVESVDEALTKGPYDLAILAVKSYDTDELLESLKPYSAALPAIVCFQNGVENEQKLAEALGVQKVIYGTVTTAIGKSAFNHIVVEKLRGIGVCSSHSIVPALVSAMNAAGLRGRAMDHPLGMKWSKMLTNIMSNASSAILQMTPLEVFLHPGLYHLEILQIREALAVMKKAGIPLVNLPGVPLRLLMAVVKYLPEWISRRIVAGSVGKGRGDKMPSFYLDLAAGRSQSEVAYLNGAIARWGERYQVATPINQQLTEILLEIVQGKRAWEKYKRQPGVLLHDVGLLEETA